jgi:hypothetical protein
VTITLIGIRLIEWLAGKRSGDRSIQTAKMSPNHESISSRHAYVQVRSCVVKTPGTCATVWA